MAVSFSTVPRLFCGSYRVTPSKPLYPIKPFSLSFNFSPQNHQIFSVSCRNHSCAFKCSMSSQENSVEIMTEGVQDDQDDQEAPDTNQGTMWESVDNLVKYYKEAIQEGNNQTIVEIESAFYKLELETNNLVEKLSTLSEEITAGKEKYIRLQADFDNFRKRSEKEMLSVRGNVKEEVIESFLPMVDNFERAKQQIKPESEREIKIDTSYQGIYKQFVEIMRSLQVAAIATVGKPFDPTLHEAIAREESEEFKEGIVSQEFRRGFLLGDRLLRPAMVKVSSGPGRKKDTGNTPTQQTAPSNEQTAAATGLD